jgi:hypothetical protein
VFATGNQSEHWPFINGYCDPRQALRATNPEANSRVRNQVDAFGFIDSESRSSSCVLEAQASTPASFAFFRPLLFQCECGVDEGFLIAAEPSIPGAILGVNATSNHFAGRLAKMGLVA